MLAGVILTLYLLGMLPIEFKELEAKQSVVMHRDQATHQLLNRQVGCTLTIENSPITQRYKQRAA